MQPDVTKLRDELTRLNAQQVHQHLEGDGFVIGHSIVQNPHTGVMVAASATGYRISYYCPPISDGAMVDLPVDTNHRIVAHLARLLHQEEQQAIAAEANHRAGEVAVR